MKKPVLLILKAGAASEALARDHGDYDRWFMEALGEPSRFRVAHVFSGEPFPSLVGVDGIIVTGSPLSVCLPEPWMHRTAERLLDEEAHGRSMLGVCFGHQLLAWAHGAEVVRNPRGREIGTITVQLTTEGQADPLFDGFGPVLRVQATHTDVASRIPDGAVLLATNENTPVQALRYGERVRGVQFHPELRAEALRALIRTRYEPIRAEGLDPVAIEAAVTPEEGTLGILRNFERML